MPKVVFLPHEEFCPEGMVIEAKKGDNLLELARVWRFITLVMDLVLVRLATL